MFFCSPVINIRDITDCEMNYNLNGIKYWLWVKSRVEYIPEGLELRSFILAKVINIPKAL